MRTKENNNMSKVSYANLKLKVDTSVDTFDFNNQTIEVLKYLPIEDIISFILSNIFNIKYRDRIHPMGYSLLMRHIPSPFEFRPTQNSHTTVKKVLFDIWKCLPTGQYVRMQSQVRF